VFLIVPVDEISSEYVLQRTVYLLAFFPVFPSGEFKPQGPEKTSRETDKLQGMSRVAENAAVASEWSPPVIDEFDKIPLPESAGSIGPRFPANDMQRKDMTDTRESAFGPP